MRGRIATLPRLTFGKWVLCPARAKGVKSDRDKTARRSDGVGGAGGASPAGAARFFARVSSRACSFFVSVNDAAAFYPFRTLVLLVPTAC